MKLTLREFQDFDYLASLVDSLQQHTTQGRIAPRVQSVHTVLFKLLGHRIWAVQVCRAMGLVRA